MRVYEIVKPVQDAILHHPALGFVRWWEGPDGRFLTWACGPEEGRPLVVDDVVLFDEGWSLASETELDHWREEFFPKKHLTEPAPVIPVTALGPEEMADLTAAMKVLVAKLRGEGFKGLQFPDIKLCEIDDMPPRHYTIAGGVYWDFYSMRMPDGADEYLDWAQYEYDFEMMLKEHFTFPGEETVLARSYEHKKQSELAPGRTAIVVSYREGCQELEVYRIGPDGKSL